MLLVLLDPEPLAPLRIVLDCVASLFVSHQQELLESIDLRLIVWIDWPSVEITLGGLHQSLSAFEKVKTVPDVM